MKMTEAQVARIMRARNNNQKSGMDRLDLEAEREGSAIRTNRQFAPSILGKRIAKNSRQADGIAKTAEFNATKYIVAETAKRVEEHRAPARRMFA